MEASVAMSTNSFDPRGLYHPMIPLVSILIAMPMLTRFVSFDSNYNAFC